MSTSTGRAAEDAIADCLARHGCDFQRQAAIGFSIYGSTIRADFLVRNFVAFPQGLAIESKWQDTAGTADEKFPYLVANVREGRYARPVIAVVYGGGFRQGALNWLHDQVDGQRLVAVHSFEGFLSWLKRHGLVHATSPKLLWTTPSSRV